MAWRIPIVDLAAEYAEVGAAVEEAVLRVLRSGRYVLGPETTAFEAELAALVGVPFAVGVGSGTEALVLALRAVGVEPGDEVVTSAFTFFATAEAILQCGARPVFTDVEPEGFNLAPSGFEAAVTQGTRAVVPVHLFGRCADMPRIVAIAGRHGIAVVEDAAQSIGAARAGRRAGAWGAAGCFSFYPAKNLGGAGDGGGVTTSEPEVAERLRLLRSHGTCADGGHLLAGTTSRLDSLQAAVLRAKLPYLEAWTDARARNAGIYAEELAGCPGVALPGGAPDEEIVWSQYTIRCREPERVRAALEARGIEWRHYYPRPVCEEPGLGGFRRPAAAFPEAARACAQAISLPVRANCSPEVIREIAGVIRDALGG
ncbi:MAG: DegT/DnrJ/EryC1/StrS family aminotransferase [Deltaproteobacteria bacterium]|nr:DegT/DnrJ/EryC1/StrS family aminotransferase [Deltaproteobacteria bacterium]